MSISPKTALLDEYALVARAMSAPARLRLLEQLAQGECGVEALADKTGLNVANASQHLQQLRRAGLATSRREGRAVIYRLSDSRTLALMAMLRDLAESNIARVGEILRDLAGGQNLPDPVTRDDLAARMRDGAVTVLDVRPADEYAAGHIPGALHATVAGLDTVLPALSRDGEIVAYCRGPYCLYAHEAVAALRRLGYRARPLDGGLPEWREEGREVSFSP